MFRQFCNFTKFLGIVHFDIFPIWVTLRIYPKSKSHSRMYPLSLPTRDVIVARFTCGHICKITGFAYTIIDP